MHCYLDLIYQTWQPVSKPPPVPMAPQVVEQHHNSITLEWFPPISGHFYDRWNELHRLPDTRQKINCIDWFKSIVFNWYIDSSRTVSQTFISCHLTSTYCLTLPCCSTHWWTSVWLASKLFALPVYWFPREVGSVCDKCTEGRVLLQYASNSSSPRPCAPSGHWSPREAEGTIW